MADGRKEGKDKPSSSSSRAGSAGKPQQDRRRIEIQPLDLSVPLGLNQQERATEGSNEKQGSISKSEAGRDGGAERSTAGAAK